jgi:tetraacyldisaccharide 4'-kinase
MKHLRKLLFPFALVYGLITAIRNLLYDKGILKSVSFAVPVIAVGNLSTGGTGKTPQTEYLIRLLQNKYRLATLSRGYKRKSKGFVLADENSNAESLGDEPYQFYCKFPNIKVTVDADRVNGINQLLALPQKPEVILLDDAYQHRRVKAGFYILLTAYGDIYADDFTLPMGNLRESRNGASRADVIVVTKCPAHLPAAQQEAIRQKLKPLRGQQVFFTAVVYDDAVYNENTTIAVSEMKAQQKILVAGIAKPEPFFAYLQGPEDTVLAYPDHHDFTHNEISELQQRSQKQIIITTEKDYMRLKGKLPADKLFYLPIKSAFLDREDEFSHRISEYAKTNNAAGL